MSNRKALLRLLMQIAQMSVYIVQELLCLSLHVLRALKKDRVTSLAEQKNNVPLLQLPLNHLTAPSALLNADMKRVIAYLVEKSENNVLFLPLASSLVRANKNTIIASTGGKTADLFLVLLCSLETLPHGNEQVGASLNKFTASADTAALTCKWTRL